MENRISVAVIESDETGEHTHQIIIAPMVGDSVDLDRCPYGTVDVHSFRLASEAAEFIGCSEEEVWRRHAQVQAIEDAEWIDAFTH
jgi:hypothetical protein